MLSSTTSLAPELATTITKRLGQEALKAMAETSKENPLSVAAREGLKASHDALVKTFMDVTPADATTKTRNYFEAFCAHVKDTEHKTSKGIPVSVVEKPENFFYPYVNNLVNATPDVTWADVCLLYKAYSPDPDGWRLYSINTEYFFNYNSKIAEEHVNRQIPALLRGCVYYRNDYYDRKCGTLSFDAEMPWKEDASVIFSFSPDSEEWDTFYNVCRSKEAQEDQRVFWQAAATLLQTATFFGNKKAEKYLKLHMLSLLYKQKFPFTCRPAFGVYLSASFVDVCLKKKK